MPFIDAGEDFKSAKETPLAPEGDLYDLICDEAKYEDGKDYIEVPIRFETSEYRPMRHFLNLPRDADANRDNDRGVPAGTTRKNKQIMIKRFYYLFNISYSDEGFDTDLIAGARARAGVSQSDADDRGNIYNNIILPRLPDES